MSNYTISNIVRDVEVCMDEIAANDSELEGIQDNAERATIIKSKIPEALRFALVNADASMLEPDQVATSVSTVTVNSLSHGTYICPPNFLRLVYAKYSTWARALGHEDIIQWNDKEYARLSDKYATGTDKRPAIAMGYSGQNKILELYPAPASGTVAIGIMTEPGDLTGKTDSDSVSIPSRCYRAVIYYIAGLTYVTYGEQQRSAMMFEQANDILGISQQAKPNNA